MGLLMEDLAVIPVAILGKMYGKQWEEFLSHTPNHLLWVSKIPSLESQAFVSKNKAALLQASTLRSPWELVTH